jgi:hypothetical protein
MQVMPEIFVVINITTITTKNLRGTGFLWSAFLHQGSPWDLMTVASETLKRKWCVSP